MQTCRNVVVWLLSTLGSVRGWSGLCCVVATWGEVRYYVNLCSSLVTLQHLVTPPHTAQKNNKCNLGLVPRAQFQISNNCYSSLYLVFLNKEWKSQVINLFLCSLFAPSKGYQWVLTNDQIAKKKFFYFPISPVPSSVRSANTGVRSCAAQSERGAGHHGGGGQHRAGSRLLCTARVYV